MWRPRLVNAHCSSAIANIQWHINSLRWAQSKLESEMIINVQIFIRHPNESNLKKKNHKKSQLIIKRKIFLSIDTYPIPLKWAQSAEKKRITQSKTEPYSANQKGFTVITFYPYFKTVLMHFLSANHKLNGFGCIGPWCLVHPSSVKASVIQANNSFFIWMYFSFFRSLFLSDFFFYVWTRKLSSLREMNRSDYTCKHLWHGNWKFQCRNHKIAIQIFFFYHSTNLRIRYTYTPRVIAECDQCFHSRRNFIRNFGYIFFLLSFSMHFKLDLGTWHFYELYIQRFCTLNRSIIPIS